MGASTEVLGVEGTGTSAAAAPIALDQPIDPNAYICGPGDVFDLNFWGPQNFRMRIAADLEGRAFISKVGFVTVAGRTLNDVRAQVRKKVRGTYPGLNFELTLASPRTFIVHLAGNVKQPGGYSAQALERVSNVLARAGGPTGSRRKIAIERKHDEKLVADLVLYELTGNTAYNPFVLDGDVIRVPFAELAVEIAGAVRRPGKYELVRSMDLTELLELAGGFSPDVTETLPIRLVRRNEREQLRFIELPFGARGSPPNHALRDEDSILVRGYGEMQRTVLLLGAVVGSDPLDTATTSRRLPYVEGDTVLSLIDRAGGIKAPGDLRRSYIARLRKDQDVEHIPIDLEALLVKRDFKADRKVAMGDTIVIPPMQYSVLVEGAVPRAGMYQYNPLFGVREYIARAGGRSRTAKDMDDVRVIDVTGNMRPYRDGLRLSPGDAILVPERNFTRAEVAQLVLASAGLVLSGLTVAYLATR
jgi:polysaccharide biosynthesis/export protein